MLNTSLHRNLLLQILKDIYSDITLGPKLGFKGGTAAYLCYGLDRFSVDLDFDFLQEFRTSCELLPVIDVSRELNSRLHSRGRIAILPLEKPPSREESFAKRETHVLKNETTDIFEKIKNIIKNYGTIKESYDKRYTLFFLLSYQHELHNIKIEISKRQFGSHYHIENYLGIPLLVMNKEDVFANKLVALIEREGKTNRDIYDVWFFLKNQWPMNKVIVEKRTKKSYKDAILQCISIIDKKSDRGILSGIGELLDEKQKRWVKQHLKQETIFLLRLQEN